MEMMKFNQSTAFLALIGDLRDSRKLPDRSRVQQSLEEVLARANRDFEDGLASRLVLTLGDEFQGLLIHPARVLPVIELLSGIVPPGGLRFGLGWGTLSTPLKEESLAMDGPCFHGARDALARGKRADRWVTVGGFGVERDSVLNGIFGLMDGVRRRWKPAQAETVRLMREAGTQKDVARVRGVDPSSVSRTLKAALHGSLVEAEESLEILLAEYMGEGKKHD